MRHVHQSRSSVLKLISSSRISAVAFWQKDMFDIRSFRVGIGFQSQFLQSDVGEVDCTRIENCLSPDLEKNLLVLGPNLVRSRADLGDAWVESR